MNANQKYEKYQSILPTVMNIIFGVFLTGAVMLTVKSFPLYAPGETFGSQMRETVWTIMTLPSVILPISLLLTNMLSRKFSGRFILLSFLCCAFFIAARIIYSYTDDTTVNYLVCLGSFYMIYLCFLVGMNELVKPKITNRKAGFILPSVLAVLFGVVLFVVLKYEFSLPYLARTVICAALPIIMLTLLLVFLSLAICGKASAMTVILSAVLPIFGIFLAVFEFSFSKVAIIIYIFLLVALFIKIILDIFALKQNRE